MVSILVESANVPHMDSKDHQIIAELQANGRLTNQELADRVNLSPSPCSRRVRLLEEAGVILGYKAVVDQKALGLPITAFIRIKLDRHDDETVTRVEEQIGNMPEVIDLWLMTGRWDYQLRVLAADLEAYEGFVRGKLHRLAGISAIDTSFAYGCVRQSNIVSIAPQVKS